MFIFKGISGKRLVPKKNCTVLPQKWFDFGNLYESEWAISLFLWRIVKMGQWCGSVGRAVTSNTRDLGLNPVIGKIYIEHLFIVNCIEKTKIKKKRLGMAHFFKKRILKITAVLRSRNGFSWWNARWHTRKEGTVRRFCLVGEKSAIRLGLIGELAFWNIQVEEVGLKRWNFWNK